MAEVTDNRTAGVALVNPHDGAVERMIETYSPPTQALGAFSGAYAVWEENPDPSNIDEFTIKEWSAATGSITTVGGSHKTASGQTIAGSDEDPVISGDHAAWVEGLKNDGTGEIVLLDLRTGERTIVRRGHPGWLALTPTTLVWAESPSRGADTTIRAMTLATGKPTAPPAALARARGAWGFVTDGTGWAWYAGDPESLYGAATSSSQPVKLGKVLDGGGSPPIAIADGIAAAPVSAGGTMIANLATRAWTYEPDGSFVTTDGRDLFAPRLVTSKAAGAPTSIGRLDRAAIGKLACGG